MKAASVRVQTLDELYDTFSKTVYWAAYQNLRDRELSADVMQNVFLSAYRNMEKLNSMTNEQVRSWLYRCAVNSSIDMLRKGKRLVVTQDAGKDEASSDKGPAEQLIENERRLAVRKALDELPAKYSEPLNLFYFAEMDYKQISALINISEGALKSRMSRGRALLLKALEKGGAIND